MNRKYYYDFSKTNILRSIDKTFESKFATGHFDGPKNRSKSKQVNFLKDFFYCFRFLQKEVKNNVTKR